MTRSVKLVAIAALVLAAIGTLSAHHSFAGEYDINKKVTMTGTISKIEWTNPHTYYYLDVVDANGQTVTWALEGFPPGSLTRIGWKRTTIKIGDKVTVIAFLSRDGSHRANAREYTLPDGTKLLAGAAQVDPAGER
jgi:Family of unknown function (DUF6152)